LGKETCDDALAARAHVPKLEGGVCGCGYIGSDSLKLCV
jgi:hypothetical protein